MFQSAMYLCSSASVFEREARELEVIFRERVIQLLFEFERAFEFEHYVPEHEVLVVSKFAMLGLNTQEFALQETPAWNSPKRQLAVPDAVYPASHSNAHDEPDAVDTHEVETTFDMSGTPTHADGVQRNDVEAVPPSGGHVKTFDSEFAS